MSTGEYWTTSEAAAYCATTPAGYRRYVSRLGAPAPVGRAPGRGGESVYNAEAVRAWQARRTGRGARVDLHAEDARRIAEQIRVDWPPVDREIHVREYETTDGVTVTVEWTRRGVAAAVGGKPILMNLDHLEQRIGVMLWQHRQNAQRTAKADAAALRRRNGWLDRLRAAARAVVEAHAEQGRRRYPDAQQALRLVIRDVVEESRAYGPGLTDEEIAEASGLDLASVERETYPYRTHPTGA